MFNNNVRSRFIKIPVNYPDKENPDLMHYELRTFDTLRMVDNRISDLIFPNATYPSTWIQPSIQRASLFFVDRGRPPKGGWVCLERESKRVIARFKTFDDALDFAKAKEKKQLEKESRFSNKITF